MQRLLAAVFLTVCMLASLSIGDAIAATPAMGMCKEYAKANHCHANYSYRTHGCLCWREQR
jgi:hypothetical protein